jgi:hypothetical protein
LQSFCHRYFYVQAVFLSMSKLVMKQFMLKMEDSRSFYEFFPQWEFMIIVVIIFLLNHLSYVLKQNFQNSQNIEQLSIVFYGA